MGSSSFSLTFTPSTPSPSNSSSYSSSISKPNTIAFTSKLVSKSNLSSLQHHQSFFPNTFTNTLLPNSSSLSVVAAMESLGPLKIMISGAPASGKGTQCELITEKYDLVHVAAGDLLRAEIAAGTENGRQAKNFMEKGQLVPDEIVVMMVKERLLQPDSQEKGWLLDGYPRSSSQATALKELGFQPDLFILLEVPEDLLVERVVGRRLDPVTGKIYHLTYSPPETEEIAARLTQRFDDTEEKVKLRLHTHNSNVESVLSMYEDIIVKVNGSVSMEEVFGQIDHELTKLIGQKQETVGSVAA